MMIRATLAVLIAAVTFFDAPRPVTREMMELDPFVGFGAMERRARELSDGMAGVERRYWLDVYPIEAALLRTGRVRDPRLARVAAWAIVREVETRHLSAKLVASVMRRENPWLLEDTTSSAGAVGWMQIMPAHAGDGAHPCGPDLTDGPTSVCYGTDILRTYVGEELDRAVSRALDRYSGCIRTPGCQAYAVAVLAMANEMSP